MAIEYRTLGTFNGDKHQSSDLERIERHAHHAMNSAISLTGAVRLLRAQPKFETAAEAALKSAEAELELTLDAVRKAISEFSTKPVTAFDRLYAEQQAAVTEQMERVS